MQCVWCNKLKLERETTQYNLRKRCISYQRPNTFLGGHDFFVIFLSLSLSLSKSLAFQQSSFSCTSTRLSHVCVCKSRANILRGSRNYHSTMRIRKRLALCSSVPTPPPLSDLHLRRTVAAPPSDPPTPPSEQTKRWDFPSYEEKMKQKEFADDEGVNSNNDIRKIVSICHGEEECFNSTNNIHPSSSSSSSLQEEGYKLVPLKKRKGNFERNTKEESKSGKMKSKTNKKYGGDVMMAKAEDGSLKKNKRGNVIMEGSRCSRVNGRGWRCCQPTLVGYSLCDHHLGKGRLRSAANVRSTTVKKKRTKVGVVKARSMTSLLSQI